MEEASEFATAASKHNSVEMLDALCDLLYVVYGAAEMLNLDLEAAFAEVHRSNMTKLMAMDSGGKIIKGYTYEPPILKLLEHFQ